jgi:hypothetical protein
VQTIQSVQPVAPSASVPVLADVPD